MKKDYLNKLKGVVFGILLVVGISYAHAWTGPTTTAPGGNVALPINVSNVDQVKNGGLAVNTFAAFQNALFKQNVQIPKIASATGVTQTPICADTTGNLVKCDPTKGIVPMNYITQENSGDIGNHSYNSGNTHYNYQWVDNNMNISLNDNNGNPQSVYTEWFDTSGLFTLAHDGDVVTVKDMSFTFPTGNINSSIGLKVQMNGTTIFCKVDSNSSGSSYTFTVHAGNTYMMSTNSSIAGNLYYQVNNNTWKDYCSY